MEGEAVKRNTGIDIIIPVYNALEDLKVCVESILRHTDLSLDRLLVIDDQSPDPNVYPYLQSIEQPGIVVLRNEHNLGFPGTVNVGMAYSRRDVLLLNSDTVVTAGWIDKITACAYSDPAIGTVTPFSNNATLCSIPNFCEENTVPYGLSIDEYAGVIERSSMREYPRITVAMGFCMFIKREVIDKVGLFDAETFRKGYGEENDFCWRAEQLGYHQVLCDDTYIYHSGTASFLSEEKRKLNAEHERILAQRYPKQIQSNAEYVRDNPHQYLRKNADLYAKLHNGKKNILYVLHLDFRVDSNNNVGGTQFHVKDLTTHLRQDHNVFVLARDAERLRLTVYLEHEQTTFVFLVGKKPDFQTFHSEAISKVYRQILSAFAIDLVHVHHVIDLSMDIFSITKELGIPLLLTLHDYYYICPSIRLLENETHYCGGCGKDCIGCLHTQLGYSAQVNYLPIWQENCRQALSLCDGIFAPSEAAKEVYAKNYPEIAQRIRVVPHGMDPCEPEVHAFQPEPTPGFAYCIEHAFQNDYVISGWALQEGKDSCHCEIFVHVEDGEGNRGVYQALNVNRQDLAQEQNSKLYLYSGFTVQIPDGYFASGALQIQLFIKYTDEYYYGDIVAVKGYVKREKNRRRVAFLGGLNAAKGSQLAYQLIKLGGNRYDWYIVGGVGDPSLLTLDRRNVFKTGWYKRESVGAILHQNQIDLVCILPIWPETFCYTISEAELAGIPLLVTDIGAPGERLRRDETGLLISPNATVEQMLGAIDGFFADKEQYQRLCDKVASFRHRTIEDMCQEYREIYSAILLPTTRPAEFDARAIYHAYILCQAEESGYGSGTTMELIQRISELEATLTAINQTTEYRMVKFFNRENVPFKRQIKWMIGFAYRVYVKFFKR